MERFLAAAPPARRAGLRALLALAARPRGAALLKRLAPLDQLGEGLLALGRYDELDVACALGFDAEAIAARGRRLRRAEGRP